MYVLSEIQIYSGWFSIKLSYVLKVILLSEYKLFFLKPLCLCVCLPFTANWNINYCWWKLTFSDVLNEAHKTLKGPKPWHDIFNQPKVSFQSRPSSGPFKILSPCTHLSKPKTSLIHILILNNNHVLVEIGKLFFTKFYGFQCSQFKRKTDLMWFALKHILLYLIIY